MFSFLASLAPRMRDSHKTTHSAENITIFLNKKAQHTAYLAFTSLSFICMWIFFGSVEYIKNKKPYLRKQHQCNIVTFNQNFYFYIVFLGISISLTIIRLIISSEMPPSANVKLIIMMLSFFRLLFVYLIRPLTIIFLLKKRLPHFFENYKKAQNVISIFHVSGKIIGARNENFQPFKSFNQNARFGSENKFNAINLSIRIKNAKSYPLSYVEV